MRLVAATLLALSACAHDTRTAVEHEHEAAVHRAEAQKAESVARVEQNTLPPPTAVEQQMSPTTPFTGYEAGRASVEVQSAEQHERAAQRIREAAALACKHVPPQEQVSCPVATVGPTRVERTPHGVRITPVKPPAAESLRAQIDCAVANASVDRPVDAERCPLFAPGAHARVVDSAQGPSIEIDTDDEAQSDEVRRRAAALSTPPAASTEAPR